jgi:peptide/nickel transport system substrate-binding protein
MTLFATSLPKFKAALMAGFIAATLAASPAAEAVTFRIADQGDITSMDPHSLNESLQLSYLQSTYEPLVARDKKLGMVPGLATKWTQVNPTTWRFDLRKGVKFHDGTPFTARWLRYEELYERRKRNKEDRRSYGRNHDKSTFPDFA